MGFERDDDGYLQVLLDPDRDAGEVDYLDVRRALERVDNEPWGMFRALREHEV